MSELDEAMQRHPSSGQLQEVIARNAVRSFIALIKGEQK